MEINWQLFHPLRFQAFCRDLMKRHLGVEQVEAFAPGPDGGIDLRAHDSTTIIQCKHYSGEKRHLFRALKEEALKERVKTAKRYIVLTTHRLSPADKDIIKDIFPNVHSTEDVLGGDDLEGIVATYPDIRKLYPQLWLGDEDRLRQLFRDELDKSTDLITQCEWEKIIETLQYVAKPPLADEAASILQEHHALIITGKPGIGKTTLAYYLIWHIVQELEYEFVYVSSNIETAFQKFNEKKKQIFLYDDFLGANFIKLGLEKNEDKRIPLFLNKIAKTKNKLAIFTTREFIFQQALFRYEHLREERKNIKKLLLEIKTNENTYKAEILYNHLWHRHIPFKNIERLFFNENGHKWANDCFLSQIIEHKYFNPRIIAFSLATARATSDDCGFPQYILQTLNNPYILYETAFSKQLSDLEKTTLLVLGLFSGQIIIGILEKAVMAQYENNELPLEETFEEALNVLVGDFLTSSRVAATGHSISINFTNPGVRDFINAYYIKNIEILKRLISRIVYPEQLLSIIQTIRGTRAPAIEQIENRITDKGLSFLSVALENDAITGDIVRVAEVLMPFLNDEQSHLIRDIIEKESADAYPSMDIDNIDSYLSLIYCYEDDEEADININTFINEAFDRYNNTDVFRIFDELDSLKEEATQPYSYYPNVPDWERSYLQYLKDLDSIADWDEELYILNSLSTAYPHGIADINFEVLKSEVHYMISRKHEEEAEEEDFYSNHDYNDGWQRFTDSASKPNIPHSPHPLKATPAGTGYHLLVPPHLAIFQTLERDM